MVSHQPTRARVSMKQPDCRCTTGPLTALPQSRYTPDDSIRVTTASGFGDTCTPADTEPSPLQRTSQTVRCIYSRPSRPAYIHTNTHLHCRSVYCGPSAFMHTLECHSRLQQTHLLAILKLRDLSLFGHIARMLDETDWQNLNSLSSGKLEDLLGTDGIFSTNKLFCAFDKSAVAKKWN